MPPGGVLLVYDERKKMKPADGWGPLVSERERGKAVLAQGKGGACRWA